MALRYLGRLKALCSGPIRVPHARPHARFASSGYESDSPSQQLLDKLVQEKYPSSNGIPVASLVSDMENVGLRIKVDPRLDWLRGKHRDGSEIITAEELSLLPEKTQSLVMKIAFGQPVVPDFSKFTKQFDDIHDSCASMDDGKIADYIPQLARVNPSLWGVSLCTVDGQRHSCGDSNVKFSIQSTGKCLNYALISESIGWSKIHQYIGTEPSGLSFNELALSKQGKPHNPLINSGAIVLCSLFIPEKSNADRINNVLEKYGRLSGGDAPSINVPIYNSEKEHADRNKALAYFMKENKCFPSNFVFEDTLDLYFLLCSIEITCEIGAVMAATLANGGTCPITGEKVVGNLAVRDTLTLMHSCGMYDVSGEFAFNVGLPAKSGVSGVIMLVIPEVMGICMYSPKVNLSGHSVKGMEFSKRLVDKYNLHIYETADRKKLLLSHCA